MSDSTEYEGGELVFESDAGEQRIKGAAGEALLYAASTYHRVEPVTKGTRLVAATWIQSMIRDATQRRILFDLAQVASGLEAEESQAERASRVRKS